MLYEERSQAIHPYREFAIELTRDDGALHERGTYRAVTTDSNGGQIAGTFYNPIDPWQVESVLASIPSGSKALQRSVPGGSLDPARDISALSHNGALTASEVANATGGRTDQTGARAAVGNVERSHRD
jgi:hypothetical protein